MLMPDQYIWNNSFVEINKQLRLSLLFITLKLFCGVSGPVKFLVRGVGHNILGVDVVFGILQLRMATADVAETSGKKFYRNVDCSIPPKNNFNDQDEVSVKFSTARFYSINYFNGSLGLTNLCYSGFCEKQISRIWLIVN